MKFSKELQCNSLKNSKSEGNEVLKMKNKKRVKTAFTSFTE